MYLFFGMDVDYKNFIKVLDLVMSFLFKYLILVIGYTLGMLRLFFGKL